MIDKPEIVNFDTTPPLQVVQYDDLISKFVPGYEVIYQLVLAHFRTVLTPNAKVLVVGAGSGKELVTLGKRMSGWTLTGVDPSSHILALARQKIAQNGLTERVTLHQGLVEDLPLTTQFDAATSILVMHFLPDDGAKLAFLTNIAARLKPNAPLMLVDIYGGRDFVKEFGSTWISHGELMGLNKETMQNLEKGHDAMYPIPEARLSGYFYHPNLFLNSSF